ncbi:MAG: bifunctional adenosylcobinamide kinase/adenosylcobinamide-phosphate guanylyltransferase [Desulfovibrionaceae bacterium]
MITLILGGNKSGKSARALDLVAAAPGPACLVVTGRALDMDFREQILEHKRTRERSLPVLESGPHLPHTLQTATTAFRTVLVDGLDFWLYSVMDQGDPEGNTAELVRALDVWTGPDLFLVSLETGLGPLPSDPAHIRFVQRLGRLNQALARAADRVELVAAGLALQLK